MARVFRNVNVEGCSGPECPLEQGQQFPGLLFRRGGSTLGVQCRSEIEPTHKSIRVFVPEHSPPKQGLLPVLPLRFGVSSFVGEHGGQVVSQGQRRGMVDPENPAEERKQSSGLLLCLARSTLAVQRPREIHPAR